MERQSSSIACLAACLLVIGVIGCAAASDSCPSYSTPYAVPNMAPMERIKSVRGIWQQQQQTQQPLNRSCLEALQHQAWEMFDHAFSNYMKHAFPQDNLLPISCKGADWQGGVGLTLIDSLDMLLLLNRRADIQEALQHLAGAVSFEKDKKVHVFETTIRVLGGLLSGHVLLDSDSGIIPEYDGLLLSLAVDLGERLLAAFKTPSGLPGLHVHLQKGMIDTEQVSCTACAGTLLLEFGLLSKLTGREHFMEAAHHAAQLLFDQRSRLGLVGSGFHVVSRTWSQRDSTIGPGSDSYYEYLLKAYLMFGDRSYLDMFSQLYVATMKHMQVPGERGASSSAFLLDVHMDSGRLLKPWVSSLGAFWPAMQVLAGQHVDAARLHSNFTAAWSTWGWLPEVFGADLSAVHPDDPGYNLRPEHIESTWYLKALTGDPTGQYTHLAASIMQVLNHSRTECGYAPIKNVNTGSQTDLMESYFLSETMKYLYLSFIDSAPLLDYYLLSTEGHLMPVFPHASESHAPGLNESEHSNKQHGDSDSSNASGSSSPTNSGQPDTCDSDNSSSGSALTCSWDSNEHIVPVNTSGTDADRSLVGKPLQQLPSNCWELCTVRAEAIEDGLERRLHAAMPLLPVRRVSSRRIRYRRCVACIHTTEALAANPPDSVSLRLARLNYGHGHAEVAAGTPMQTPANSLPPDVIHQLGTAAQGVVLAQLVCVLRVVGPKGRPVCKTLRRLTALDNAVGLDAGTLILQLTAVPQQKPTMIEPSAMLLAGFESLEEEGPVVLQLTGVAAAFGPPLPELSSRCLGYLSQPRVRLAALPSCPLVQPGQPPGYLHSSSWKRRQLQQQRQLYLGAAGPSSTSSSSSSGGDEFWVRDAVAADSWLAMSPSAHSCWPLLQQAEANWFTAAAAAAADWFNSSRGLDSSSMSDVSQRQNKDKLQQGPGPAAAVSDPPLSSPAPAAAVFLSDPSPALLASCVGYDASTEFGGRWVSAAEFMRPGGGCERHSISELPRAAPLVMAHPRNGCGGHLDNAAMIQGAIAVVLRGNCGFLDKVMAADAAGAVGVVVLNVQGKGELLVMSGDDSGRSPDIPAVLVGGDDALQLLWWMERRPLLGALTAYDTVQMQQQQLQQQGDSERSQLGEQDQQEAGQGSSSKGKEKQGETKQQVKQGSSKQDGRALQSKRKTRAGSVGDAAASAAVGAATLSTVTAAGQPAAHALVQTRVDLFVPGRSQKWLQDNVVKAGGDVSSVYAAVLRDTRVMSALQSVLSGNRGKP